MPNPIGWNAPSGYGVQKLRRPVGSFENYFFFLLQNKLAKNFRILLLKKK
jgi:hypothetical protein